MNRDGGDVGPNASIRGSTVIGPSAHVDHGFEVNNSVLMADASVGHISSVSDSVLGRGVNFGAGTIVATLRHDDATVRILVNGELVDTDRRTLGVVVGDEAKTRINTSLNAGVTVGVEQTTAPGDTLTRYRRFE